MNNCTYVKVKKVYLEKKDFIGVSNINYEEDKFELIYINKGCSENGNNITIKVVVSPANRHNWEILKNI